jgi:hypothetical protein
VQDNAVGLDDVNQISAEQVSVGLSRLASSSSTTMENSATPSPLLSML